MRTTDLSPLLGHNPRHEMHRDGQRAGCTCGWHSQRTYLRPDTWGQRCDEAWSRHAADLVLLARRAEREGR